MPTDKEERELHEQMLKIKERHEKEYGDEALLSSFPSKKPTKGKKSARSPKESKAKFSAPPVKEELYPDMVELAKQIFQSEDTTEYLMLTLQRALNVQPPEVLDLIRDKNTDLL